jgi:hypothetical protein
MGDNIKMDLQEVGGIRGDWMELDQDRDRWRALVSTGYTLHDHKTNNSIRKGLRITSILDKIDEYRKKWLLHIQRMPQNRIPLKSYNYRRQGRSQLDDLKNVGESNCKPGDGTDQRVQSLVFMMMIIIMIKVI